MKELILSIPIFVGVAAFGYAVYVGWKMSNEE